MVDQNLVKIKLDDNSHLHLAWMQDGSLSIQLLKPGNLRDGHGLLLTGTAILSGEELTAFLADVRKTQDTQEVLI